MPDIRALWRVLGRVGDIPCVRISPRLAFSVIVASGVLLAIRGSGRNADLENLVSVENLPESTFPKTVDSIRALRTDVRKRISESYTYLGHSLAEDDSVLRRWQDRTVRMLTVFIGADGKANSTEGLPWAVRRAFDRWERVGAIPVQFRQIRDSTLAEVHVRWIRSFAMERSGQADVFWDADGWIRKATLTIATHDNRGHPIDPDVAYVVALHEIGHLLGLGHSDDPNDLMYPVTTVRDLTTRDRRTARLLYVLPPGSVRDPQ